MDYSIESGNFGNENKQNSEVRLFAVQDSAIRAYFGHFCTSFHYVNASTLSYLLFIYNYFSHFKYSFLWHNFHNTCNVSQSIPFPSVSFLSNIFFHSGELLWKLAINYCKQRITNDSTDILFLFLSFFLFLLLTTYTHTHKKKCFVEHSQIKNTQKKTVKSTTVKST